MNSWTGKTRGGMLGYKIFFFLLRNFEINISYFFLRFVTFYFVFFSPKAFKAIHKFYHSGLKYSSSKSLLMIYKNYYSFGQSILDKIAIQSGFYNKFSYDFNDEKYLLQLIEKKSGGILISAHLGNWEIAGYLLNRLNAKFKIVMLDAEHRKIKRMLENVMGEKRIDVIVVKNDNSHVFEIYDSIKNGDFICIQGDRFIEGNKTVLIDFLGNKAQFPVGMYYLGVKFNLPVLFVFAIKTEAKHYKFFVFPAKNLIHKPSEILKNKTSEIICEYVNYLEKMVIKYPEQWYNYYNFFYTEDK